MVEALTESGFATHVILPDAGSLLDRLEESGQSPQVVAAPSSLRVYGRSRTPTVFWRAAAALPLYWVRLYLHLRRTRPDILHMNDHRGVIMAAPAAVLLRIPRVWHIHGILSSRLLTAVAAKLSTVIIVPTRAAANDTPLSRGARFKVRVVSNWLRQPQSRLDGPTPASNPIIVCAASARPEKGLDVLIRASALLLSRHPGMEVRIAGGVQVGYEHYYVELQQLISDLGLVGVVCLEGYKVDAFSGWDEACIYVQPSRSETFGLAVLEAMSSGLAIAVTDVGGLSELIEDGVTGLVAPSDDPAALAAVLERLLSSALLRADLSAQASLAAATSYSLDTALTNLLLAYEEARRPTYGWRWLLLPLRYFRGSGGTETGSATQPADSHKAT